MSAQVPAKATGAAEPAFAPAAPFELSSVLTHGFESCPAVCASAGWVSALSSPPGASKCLVRCLAGGRGKGSRVCSALCLACGSAGWSRARAGWLLACRLLALLTQRWSHRGRCFLWLDLLGAAVAEHPWVLSCCLCLCVQCQPPCICSWLASPGLVLGDPCFLY